jgi:hypothetical protein
MNNYRLTEDKIKQVDKLKELFLDKYSFDILDKSRDGIHPAYRSLFNVILFKKLKLNKSAISKYYNINGWHQKSHATIINSLRKFEIHKKAYVEIECIFYEFFPVLLKKKERDLLLKYKVENQNDLQKAISDVPKERQSELLEMINLRKSSWNWKSKDKVKVYTAT